MRNESNRNLCKLPSSPVVQAIKVGHGFLSQSQSPEGQDPLRYWIISFQWDWHEVCHSSQWGVASKQLGTQWGVGVGKKNQNRSKKSLIMVYIFRRNRYEMIAFKVNWPKLQKKSKAASKTLRFKLHSLYIKAKWIHVKVGDSWVRSIDWVLYCNNISFLVLIMNSGYRSCHHMGNWLKHTWSLSVLFLNLISTLLFHVTFSLLRLTPFPLLLLSECPSPLHHSHSPR